MMKRKNEQRKKYKCEIVYQTEKCNVYEYFSYIVVEQILLT